MLDDQMTTARAVSLLVDATFNEAEAVARVVATDPFASRMNPRELDSFLQRLAPSYPQYENIAVFDATGWNAGAMLPYQPDEARISIADRPYFQSVMATNSSAVSPVLISKRTGLPTVVVCVPIRNELRQPIGVVNVALRLDYFATRLQPLQLGPGQAIFITDQTGRVAFHSGLENMSWAERDFSSYAPIARAISGEPARVSSFHSPMGDDRIAAVTPSSEYGWAVGVTMPVDRAFAQVQEMLRNQMLGFAAVAAFSVMLALIISQFLMGPVRKLAVHARALGRGKLDQRVTIQTRDELGELGATFNEMADRLQAAMQQLARTNSELRAVLDSTESGIIMVDATGKVRFVNRTMAGWFGIDPAKVVGCPRGEMIALYLKPHVEKPHEFGDRLEYLYEHPETVAEDEVEVVQSVQRTLRRYSAPMRDDEGAFLGRIEVYSDITERRRLERLRDEFLSVAAHELKTPVTTVKGYAQLLLQWAPNGHEPREGKALKAINRQSDRIDRLVRDLLEISRMQTGPIELAERPANLSELVGRVVDRVASTTSRHRLVLHADEMVPVEVDRERIEEVVGNLIENAVKYSPAGGRIEIEVVAKDGEARFSVCDHGVGIPGPEQPYIFGRFFRAHTGTPYDYGGMGVGLYISKEIIDRHGGRIGFESVEGRGSVFFFILPLALGKGNGYGS